VRKRTQRGDLSEIAQFGGGSSWLAGRSGQFAPYAPRNADAARSDHLTRQYYGRPLLLETLLLPDDAQRPRRKYLDWHRDKIFVA
jgi:hypothetical protein